MNFWEKLKKSTRRKVSPIMILAPMEGVTDTVFRQIVASVGKPDVMMTEFVPVDAILSQGSSEVMRSLQYSAVERPIVAQIWGTDPDKFFKVAKLLKKMGFDGIDINMGCPVYDVIKKGACSALIKNPKLAEEIILATIKGAEGLPVSVKTRIGFDKIQTEEWTKVLLQTPISALILHLRTTREMSKVPAHWEEISKAVKVRDQLKSNALIIGNGDIKTLNDAKDKCKEYGLDGAMIGRGIFENVYLFNNKVDPLKVTPSQKIALLLKHLKLYKKIRGEGKHFESVKKFVKCYINNFDGASEERIALMNTKTLDELTLSVLELKKTC